MAKGRRGYLCDKVPAVPVRQKEESEVLKITLSFPSLVATSPQLSSYDNLPLCTTREAPFQFLDGVYEPDLRTTYQNQLIFRFTCLNFSCDSCKVGC